MIADAAVMSKIYLIRGQKVMLDRDLADLYGVATKVLKQAVRRNKNRFPEDFMFEMSEEEFPRLARECRQALSKGFACADKQTKIEYT